MTRDWIHVDMGPLPIRQTIRRIAREHGLTYDDIVGKSRVKHIMAARRECYIALRALGMSYPWIAKSLNRTHGAVWYGIHGKKGKQNASDNEIS